MLNNLDVEDIELIEKVKSRDSKAFEELLIKYRSMIYYIINNCNLICGDFLISREDLYQEACIGLYNACLSFKDNNKAKFSTFAYMVIKRKVNHFYKDSKDCYIKESMSIDSCEDFDRRKELAVYDSGFKYNHTEELKERFIKSTKRISDQDKQILLLRMENYSYAEISKILNITTKRIDNRLMRLRTRYLKNIDTKNN